MKSWYSDLYFMQKIIERERNKNAPYYNDDFLDLFPTDEEAAAVSRSGDA